MWMIVIKEVRDSFLSSRFQVGTVLAILLVAVTVGVLVDDYDRQVTDYTRRLAANEEHLSEYGHLNRTGSVWRVGVRPTPFLSWVRGLAQSTHMEVFDNDPLPVLFPLIDVVFVITIVMSLLALVFTYDLLSGERETGTLRLLATFPLSRTQIAVGKVIGASITIAVPLLAAGLTGALVVAMYGQAQWGWLQWQTLLPLGIGSFLYLAAFAALGVLVSALFRHSKGSAFGALAAWVVLVLVVPNLAPYAAAQISPLPSITELQRRIAVMVDTERDDLMTRMYEERREELRMSDPAIARLLEIPAAERPAAVAADAEMRVAQERYSEARQEVSREANRIQRERAEALEQDFERRQDAQVRLAQRISLLSPTSAFVYLATDLTETGLRHNERIEGQGAQFGAILGEWMDAKARSLREQDPTMDVWNTQSDLSGLPRFEYETEPTRGRVVAVLPWILSLAAYGLIFSVGAVVAFSRYDVR
jgi:ABC-type transport system involved in multi-copper enzyme maturation permease subunit